jgi:hypothetical protein
MANPSEVWNAFVDERGWARPSEIPQTQVREWIDDQDLEIRGVLYELIRKPEHANRINPPLIASQLLSLTTGYFRDCASRGSVAADSRWVLSGWDLSHAIAYWANEALRSERYDETQKAEITNWLGDMLLSSVDFQALLTSAVRDHVLSDRRLSRFFRGWKNDSRLAFLFPEPGPAT